MKIKKVLAYVSVCALGVFTGAMIFSPDARGKVVGSLKTVGGKISSTVKGCGGDCEDRPHNNGGYRNGKPRYNNNKD
ncbi:MAG: hypothetical protein J6I84_04055 [Bacilli bacterium]|nr:hypothetical protein [Bacilli bacterium]